ncbi:hypothetical protein ACWCOT_36185 [Nonomuraea bangladeshensis]
MVFARYVVNLCLEEGEPCTVLRLGLSDGRVIRLADAVVPVPTPHGSYVAYYRRSDGAVVVRDLTAGKVRAVPGGWSRAAGPLRHLSPAGRYAVVGSPCQVVDTISGEVHTLPFTPDRAISFSPDNAYFVAYVDSQTVGKPVYVRLWDLADRLDVVSYLPRKYRHDAA